MAQNALSQADELLDTSLLKNWTVLLFLIARPTKNCGYKKSQQIILQKEGEGAIPPMTEVTGILAQLNEQKRPVEYADYKSGMLYVSVYEVFPHI